MSSGIDKLVNQQVLRWQAEAKAVDSHSGRSRIHIQRPVVTISRECGAMGTQIGELLATRLGFDLYDRELVEEVAKCAKVRKVLVELVDDRVQDMISTWIAEQFGGDTLSPSDYLVNLSRVMMSLGNLGRAVIVGRGAHFILDPEWTLRIRAFAPLELRIARMAEAKKITEAEATDIVGRKDRERQTFCRKQFNKDIHDPAHYDLLFNTGTLPIEMCAEAAYLAFRARFGMG